MSVIFDKLVGKQLITDHPVFIKNNIHYEAMVGSISYGVSTDSSDVDICGFCMPPKHLLFPYNHGFIHGFGTPPPAFKQFQKHHIKDEDDGKEYDIVIYNIVRFFQLCMDSNPNMVDSLFVPQRCVLSISQLGQYVRENRKVFLSQRAWHKFKGYAFSQLSKMNDRVGKDFCKLCDIYGWELDISLNEAMKDVGFKDENYVKDIFKRIDQSGHRSKRLPSIRKYGYDVKFAYNVVRLLEECHQILEEGDLDLTRSREMLKSIRKGEWEIERVNEFFDHKFMILEGVYAKSTIPEYPQEDKIRDILVEAIHMHYGQLDESAGLSVDKDIEKSLYLLQQDLDKIIRRIG